MDETHTVSSSNVTKAMGAADVAYRRAAEGSEVLKVWARPQTRGVSNNPRTCFWCDLKGHTIRECRKNKEHNENKASGSQTGKHESKLVKAVEMEADVAEVVSSPWDNPVEVTVW